MRTLVMLRRIVATSWIVLSLNLLSVVEADAGTRVPDPGKNWDITLLYAQSADVWSTVIQLDDAENDLASVQNILESKYGTYETSLTQLSFEFTRVASPVRTPLTRFIFLKVGTEGIGFGRISNPVVPELEIFAIALGTAGFGFDGYLPGPRIHTRLGFRSGLGREGRIEAVSTDAIDRLPIRNGRFVFMEFVARLSRLTSLGSHWSIESEALWQPRWFNSSIPASTSPFTSGRSRAEVKHRWRMASQLRTPTRLTGHVVAGPNPLPDENLLPAVWDYASDLQSLPDWRAALGGGLGYESRIHHHLRFSAKAGFYGGYAGGGLRLQWKRIQLSAGSWGIEATSGFRLAGQRLWLGSLGVAF